MSKIVYVEDDPEVGGLIAAYLGKHDIDVIVETRGDRAEAVIQQQQPDLVLLDIMLPGKDGMTLCRDLRPQWDGPIVLLTSLDSDMNHILSLEMGANDYILKTTPCCGAAGAFTVTPSPACFRATNCRHNGQQPQAA